jgi:hypothetical protein
MVRPGRDRLKGWVEVDETYVGGPEEGSRGRQTEEKSIVAVAAEEDGDSIGRIRLGRVPDVSAASLFTFIQRAIIEGSVIHTDGWLGYHGLEEKGIWTQGQQHKTEQSPAARTDASRPPCLLADETMASGHSPRLGQP